MPPEISQLRRYLAVSRDEKKARFFSAVLGRKIRQAREIMKSCRLCERRCGVNRLRGEKGWCRVGNVPIMSSEFMHHGEESFFVPSHTIFFMGCTLSCQYCQNWTISQWHELGRETSPEEMAEWIRSRRRQGSRNVNFVGGDPTPNLLWILETLKFLKRWKVNIPVVWNSNFYMSSETMEVLDGAVDVYLSDFKYGNDKCALRMSKVPRFWDIVTRNHKTAAEQAEVVIRHLVLPNHLDCCTFPILEWIAENLGDKVVINVMEQYRPEFRAGDYPEIDRPLRHDEFRAAVDKAEKLGLTLAG